ncbi:putative GNAT family acetyltransferase [Paenibacillus forsythiae]|uniref:GNAT family acetyltransferase n=1 Tax=Paenibacillus forsythiae TaxID=365616 RepID=A0ABU3H642_9BACL|nr:GNAT family N-acetyltransferase [Paenibacillus forsythiae]MDT3426293.1 putative GNAT family acetyltransferase [Paenibacillus forsythiae]
MIRKLNEQDRAGLLAFLGQDPALNLFLISDVENFGFDREFQEVWGEFEPESGQLKAVLLRYETNYLPYAAVPFDVQGFADIMKQDERMKMLSGSTSIAAQFGPYISFRKEKSMHFAELKELAGEPGAQALAETPAKLATLRDVESICTLMDGIDEFEENPDSMRSGMRRALETGTGRTCFVERDGRTVAAASSTAENSMSAMIVGVATHPDYRGQGLATLIVTKLCSDLTKEGKSLCLFYNNPDAASIYKRIGFRDIGDWSMMYT